MKRRTILLVIFAVLAMALLVFSRVNSLAGSKPKWGTNQRRAAASPKPRVDYSKFNHRTKQHQQACDSCHMIPTPNWSQVRPFEEAFPDITDYPDHPACINCHRREFNASRPVICTICHVTVSRRDGTRHPFQNPEEAFEKATKKSKTGSQFALNFPHDLHQDVMAFLSPSPGRGVALAFVRASLTRQLPQKRIDACTICHQVLLPQNEDSEVYVVKPPPDLLAGSYWLKKGTFMTSPTGHGSCFNCHWQDGGETPLSSDCAGCHVLLPEGRTGIFVARERTDADAKNAAAMGVKDAKTLEIWLRRYTATFNHDQLHHERLGCTACHINITGISTLDEATLKIPILTCGGGGGGCHIKPTVPRKILNVEIDKKNADPAFNCVKCHLNFGSDPTPQSHFDAVGPARN